MAIVRNCPVCNHTLWGNRDFPSIGPPVITCPSCGTYIDTSMREWAKLPRNERYGSILQVLLTPMPGMLGYLQIFLIMIFVVALLGVIDSSMQEFIVLLIPIPILYLGINAILLKQLITKSNRFTRNQEPPRWMDLKNPLLVILILLVLCSCITLLGYLLLFVLAF